MFLLQKIASALIAGVIVVVVDWKRLLSRKANFLVMDLLQTKKAFQPCSTCIIVVR
jgi:hypothetical protein